MNGVAGPSTNRLEQGMTLLHASRQVSSTPSEAGDSTSTPKRRMRSDLGPKNVHACDRCRRKVSPASYPCPSPISAAWHNAGTWMLILCRRRNVYRKMVTGRRVYLAYTVKSSAHSTSLSRPLERNAYVIASARQEGMGPIFQKKG